MRKVETISITGLSLIEARQLAGEVEAISQAIVQPEAVNPERYQDMGTTAVIFIGIAAINAISMWLAKQRYALDETTEVEIQHDPISGKPIIRVKLARKLKTSSPPDANTVKALAEANNKRLSNLIDSVPDN